MSYRKKLIEVALPLDAINDASAYDKMPGIGPHPKGIHHWWARLPLPCARAILFASLIDDPSSSPDWAEKDAREQDKERLRLFRIIRELLQKKPHEASKAFEKARIEISKATAGESPTVFDPFCGGGSIPLEASRLGLDARGSDLNPVALTITKAVLEIAPRMTGLGPVGTSERGSPGLASDIRHYAKAIGEGLSKALGELFPLIRSGGLKSSPALPAIAWIWARTVACPNPACGIDVLLVKSLVLANRKDKKTWLAPEVVDGELRFGIKAGRGKPPETKVGRGARFRCLGCGATTEDSYVKSEGMAGRLRTRLVASVAGGERGRVYVPASGVSRAETITERPEGAPDEELPTNPRWFSPPAFGLRRYSDLFTPRQLRGLMELIKQLHKIRPQIIADAERQRIAGRFSGDPAAYADAIVTFLGLAIDRCADFNNALCRWSASNEKVMNLFARQAIPMVFDFAEANLLGTSVGSWATCSAYVADCVEVSVLRGQRPGSVVQADASKSVPAASSLLVSTDPPYYDNIGYADLSDFFYVWLRRSIGALYPDAFATLLVPKAQELIATPYRFDGDERRAKEHFESGFRATFSLLRDRLDPRFPMTVYYAFKQTDDDSEVEGGHQTASTGWETLLEALISSGFQITATWPVRASQAWRMVSMGTNALASYIVLACRPRSASAPLAKRQEFVSALRRELPEALRQLQSGNVAPVDLAQASIGPGMAVFSRSSRVLEADGGAMSVRGALHIINEELDRFLEAVEGGVDPQTRFCVAWFQQFGMNEGKAGDADELIRAKNTSTQSLSSVFVAKAGKAHLLPRTEYPKKWDPAVDEKLSIWFCTQNVIRALEDDGEEAAARLCARLGHGRTEDVRLLSYRLFSICERNKWAEEAISYNALVASFSGIEERIRSGEGKPAQTSMFQG